MSKWKIHGIEQIVDDLNEAREKTLVALNEIQLLKAEIETLKAEIEITKARNDALETEIETKLKAEIAKKKQISVDWFIN